MALQPTTWLKATAKGRTWHVVIGSSGYTACGIRLPSGPQCPDGSGPTSHRCKRCDKALAVANA